MSRKKRKEEEEWIREAGLDSVRGERKVYGDNGLRNSAVLHGTLRWA